MGVGPSAIYHEDGTVELYDNTSDWEKFKHCLCPWLGKKGEAERKPLMGKNVSNYDSLPSNSIGDDTLKKTANDNEIYNDEINTTDEKVDQLAVKIVPSSANDHLYSKPPPQSTEDAQINATDRSENEILESDPNKTEYDLDKGKTQTKYLSEGDSKRISKIPRRFESKSGTAGAKAPVEEVEDISKSAISDALENDEIRDDEHAITKQPKGLSSESRIPVLTGSSNRGSDSSHDNDRENHEESSKHVAELIKEYEDKEKANKTNDDLEKTIPKIKPDKDELIEVDSKESSLHSDDKAYTSKSRIPRLSSSKPATEDDSKKPKSSDETDSKFTADYAVMGSVLPDDEENGAEADKEKEVGSLPSDDTGIEDDLHSNPSDDTLLANRDSVVSPNETVDGSYLGSPDIQDESENKNRGNNMTSLNETVVADGSFLGSPPDIPDETPDEKQGIEPDNMENGVIEEELPREDIDLDEEGKRQVWEDLLNNDLLTKGDVVHSAIVDVNDPENVKAANFQPSIRDEGYDNSEVGTSENNNEPPPTTKSPKEDQSEREDFKLDFDNTNAEDNTVDKPISEPQIGGTDREKEDYNNDFDRRNQNETTENNLKSDNDDDEIRGEKDYKPELSFEDGLSETVGPPSDKSMEYLQASTTVTSTPSSKSNESNVEKPPESYQPLPVGDKSDAPMPEPSSVPTDKAFEDNTVFDSIDRHAMKVSQEDHGTFRDFLWHLLHSKDTSLTDLEAARAIFLWLCSKDLTQLKFNSAEEGSPEEHLLNLRDRKTTYATVFSTLCSYAGLYCQTINGCAKGADYKAGDKFADKQGHHAWNAVYIDGVWRLVDCHWASRRLVGKEVSADNVKYKLDEYYFMPDPSEIKYTHFPDEVSWQLLEKSIDQREFEELVLLKSNFFKHNLEVISHPKAVNETDDGVIAMKLGCTENTNLAFTFTLCYDNGDEEYNGTKLARFAMLEMVDNVCILNVRLPEDGIYRLTMFAKDQSDTSGVYGAICEYKLVCTTTPSPKLKPFPPCVHTSWGPGDEAVKYQLMPIQEGTIFHTVQGKTEVKFNIPKAYRFTCKLRNNDVDENTLQCFVLSRVVNNVAIFTMYAPQPGEYGLEIYANDPEMDGNSLSHVYQYLIICDEEVGHVEAHPKLPISFLGEQKGFSDMGLSTISHPDPLINVDINEVTLSFNMSKPIRITSQLLFVVNDIDEDACSDYILQQGRPSEVHFQLKLPDVGWYKFQIYALPRSEQGDSFPLVYNYLIRCGSTKTAAPVHYPKQYGLWKDGCYLYSPQQGQLLPEIAQSSSGEPDMMSFKVNVPPAEALAVVIGEEWTHLESDGEGLWEGMVPMGEHWGNENKTKAMVYVNCDESNPSYSALLEYSL